ncbi:MAG: sugar ABC transporter substrate-binding protein [Clostridiales bacterium]|jgi:ribose transport system substrate-binding protein|nr:substrate-binding domain-containing protein [Bacillota bacterium]NLL54058.1 sugar ABC transporter substrate-binding protein [Clostridiales bacterium]
MKKILALFLVLTLTLGFGVAMAEEQPLVGISCPYNPTGWVAAVSWSAETTADSLGMNYLMKIAESEAEQASDLDFFINEGCEIIVLFPFNDTLEAAAQRVMDAGITLVNFDRTLGGTTPDYYLAGDNYQIGVLGAQYIAEKLGGKGKIVITTIPSYGAIFEERVNGCRDGLKEFPEIEVLGEYAADNAAQETGLALMTDILTANPELDGVYSCDDELSTGMLKAIEEQGRLGEVKVMTGCGDGQAYFKLMDEYKDKIWLSTQTYAPYMMGDCIKLAYGLTQGETYDARVIIPPETLDYTNYADWMVRNGVTEDAPF